MTGRAGGGTPEGIVAENLTAILAERVMGWSVGPHRVLMSSRRWLPTWRFKPTKNIADAFQLLDAADVLEYFLRADKNGIYRVRVRRSAASAEASGACLPLTICVAVARAYGIDVEASE